MVGGAPPAAPAEEGDVEAAVRSALADDAGAGPRQVAERVSASLGVPQAPRLRGGAADPQRRPRSALTSRRVQARRYATGGAALLPDHPDLLRQRRATRRHGVHDGERRRDGALAPPGGRRRLVHDGHRRARGQDRRGGRGGEHDAQGVDGPHLGALRRGLAGARHLQRRLHPHDRAPALQGRPGIPAADLRQRVHRAGRLRRPLLRLVRGLLHRGPAGRRQVPGARAAGDRDVRGELLLQAERVRRAVARVLRRPPRLRPAGLQAQRGARLHPGRSARRLHHRAPRSRGACRCHGTPATSSTSGTTRSSTTSRSSATGATRTCSRRAGGRGAPPDRQGHLEVPLRVVAGDVHGGRPRRPPPRSSCTATCSWAGRSWARR